LVKDILKSYQQRNANKGKTGWGYRDREEKTKFPPVKIWIIRGERFSGIRTV